MNIKKTLPALALALLLTACGDDKAKAPAEPVAAIPADARDYFNQMGVTDTGGSKGQVRRSDSGETLWFDSVRKPPTSRSPPGSAHTTTPHNGLPPTRPGTCKPQTRRNSSAKTTTSPSPTKPLPKNSPANIRAKSCARATSASRICSSNRQVTNKPPETA